MMNTSASSQYSCITCKNILRLRILHANHAPASPAPFWCPCKCCGAIKNTIAGNPDAAHINTSYSERVNLTIRMSDRRFTRLTNAFSKKLANHISSVHLHNFFYNFCRIHKSLRITPAMAAGLTDRVWTVADVAAMLEQKEEKAAQPNVVVLVPVKKRG